MRWIFMRNDDVCYLGELRARGKFYILISKLGGSIGLHRASELHPVYRRSLGHTEYPFWVVKGRV